MWAFSGQNHEIIVDILVIKSIHFSTLTVSSACVYLLVVCLLSYLGQNFLLTVKSLARNKSNVFHLVKMYTPF